MLKTISVITISVILTAPAIAESEFNQSDLVCYMQTSDGRTVDLSAICGGRTVRNRSVTTPVATSYPLSPYSNLGGLEINGRGEGAKPCFGLDDQGNRCPTLRELR